MAAKHNFKKFRADFETMVVKVQGKCEKAINKTVLDVYRKIVQRTPVGDPSLWKWPAHKDYVPGNLRASWSISLGRNQQRDKSTGRYMSEGSLYSKGGIKLNFLGAGGKSFTSISNSAPYAQIVEYGGWSYIQRPEGMVRVTLKEYPSILQSNLDSFKAF